MQHILYVLSVAVHILAATLWVGGMLFMITVLVPALRKLQDRKLMSSLIQATGKQFRLVGWITLIILLTTGYTNLLARGITHSMLIMPTFWHSGFGQVLAFKLCVFLLIIVLSLIHDFRVGPRASELATVNPLDPEALRLRKLATWFGRFNALLAIVMVACGVMLVRGRPW